MSSNNSASLDNIFLSVSEDSCSSEAFIDNLVSPKRHPKKLNLSSPAAEIVALPKTRRVSAPVVPHFTPTQRLTSPVVNERSLSNCSSARTPEGDNVSGILWMVSEGEEEENPDAPTLRSHSGPPRPYTDSLDDITSLNCNQTNSHLQLPGHYVGSLRATATGSVMHTSLLLHQAESRIEAE